MLARDGVVLQRELLQPRQRREGVELAELGDAVGVGGEDLQPAAHVEVRERAQVVVGEAQLDERAAADERVRLDEADGVAVEAERAEVARAREARDARDVVLREVEHAHARQPLEADGGHV